MRKFTLLAALLGAAFVVGCSDSGMDKNAENALRNRSGEIPKEAQEGMNKMGELVEQQKQANQAAGVDDRGIPIKSGG